MLTRLKPMSNSFTFHLLGKKEKGKENGIANKRFFPQRVGKKTERKKRIFFSTSHLVRFPLNNFKFFELSFQSSLQLSLAVLVCYRAFVGIFSLGWNLPPILRLHSQTTRLKEKIQHPRRNVKKYNTVPPNPSTKKRKENEFSLHHRTGF